MKTRLILFLFLLAANIITNAQDLIAVQNSSAPSFFLILDSAIIHSHDGDTLYIPGGIWNITKPIDKRLNLIGVGYHPDSSIATFPTTLYGNITLVTGASNGSLTGV